MILVFGKSGQVARELQRHELQRHEDVLALGRAQADLSVAGAAADAIKTHKPSLVINAAAYTAVDQAEGEEPLATQINGYAVGEMARACGQMNIPLVHISTDYVFDGSGETPWPVDAPTAPLGAYGRSKLVGEQAVQAAGGTHVILRTSWVVSPHGHNFVKTMLRLGAERDELNIVADQIGGPTGAGEIAVACMSIGAQLRDDPTKSGTYHFAGAPATSWADFARDIFRQSGVNCQVHDIPSSAYPTPAKRPFNSRLDCLLTKTVFDIDQPDWHQTIGHILKDLSK